MGNTSSVHRNLIKFSLLLLFAIPSTFCSIFIIYSFIRFKSIRQYFFYEIVIYLNLLVLLKIIFNISISLSFYARGYILPQTPSFCHFWQYADYTTSACIIWCNAIFTLERYILVFHPHYLRSKRQKMILHYLPIIISNTYIVVFYTYTILILPCANDKNYGRHLCGAPCVDSLWGLSTFNWLFNILLPVFIIIFGSSTLLTRVLWTRRKMQRSLRNWSKNWKMITQLLGIAVIYALVWIPLSVVSLMSMFMDDNSLHIFANRYIYYLTYIADMCVPIVAFIFSPEINRRLRERRQSSISHIPSRDTV